MTESDEARHWRSLLACSRLIRWIRRMYYPRVLRITAQHVVTLLHEAGIEFVLIGSHGVSGWRDQPQASEDVDCSCDCAIWTRRIKWSVVVIVH